MRNTLKNLLAITTAAVIGASGLTAVPFVYAEEQTAEAFEAAVTTTLDTLKCSEDEVEIKAGESYDIGVQSMSGYSGLPELYSSDPTIAVGLNSDTPDTFSIIGLSEGTVAIDVVDSMTGAMDTVFVTVTGELESDMFGDGVDIVIETLPDKIVYSAGESLDLTGGSFAAVYNDDGYGEGTIFTNADMTTSRFVYTNAYTKAVPGTYPIIILYKSYLGYWGAATFEVAVTSGVQGDSDCDGEVTINDAAEVLACYAENSAGARRAVAGSLGTALCDVDGNGIAEIKDAAYILEFYARNGAGLPCTWDDILSE